MTAAYPLTWPEGLERWKKQREAGPFRTGLPGALENVRKSLADFGRDSGVPVTAITLSSNVTLGQMKPADPGVAAWFSWDGEQRCIAVDRYSTPEANLQAIHHVLEARRTELRHGTLALVRATFRGLLSLPPPPPYWQVLGLSAPPADRAGLDQAYRRSARDAHPDKPTGSHAAMAAVNAAYERGKAELET